MINFINCLFLMDFYEPFEEMEANNVWFFSSRSNSYSTILLILIKKENVDDL